MGRRITVDQESFADLVGYLGLLAPRARKALAAKGASHGAWDVVREAEAIVAGRTIQPDRYDRFVTPSLDMPGKIGRLRLLARVLTRHAA